MVPDIGNLCLYLALALSLIIALGGFFRPNIKLIMLFWGLVFILVLSALGCLVYSYVVSDFSVLNVFSNSHTSKPLIYKVSGAWGNHEGSMLLWLAVIAFFSFAFAFLQLGPVALITATLSVQALIFAMFALYVILASNPFVRIFPPPLIGMGLNPILQDIGLALHPPVLYLGYIGFSLAFSASIAGLMLNKINQEWAKMLRPWVLMSWSFLTLGISLGSWWAYRELGWGGFWFWDPVENSSLMPWLCATALLHSLSVTEKNKSLVTSSVLLSILTFMFSMVGTFLVRSGIITSVHTFAVDPSRGLFILIILAILVSVALLLFALKGKEHGSNKSFYVFSQEALIFANNLLLTFVAFIIALGTFYPIIIEVISGELISVGAPYYNRIVPWITFLLIVIMAIGSDIVVVKTNIKKLLRMDTILLLLILSSFVGVFIHFYKEFKIAFLGIGLSIWLLLIMAKLFINKRQKIFSGFYAMFLGHVGVAFVVLGISICSGFQQEIEKVMQQDSELVLRGNKLKFTKLVAERGPNYLSRKAIFEVDSGDKYKTILLPETRFFLVEGQQTAETAILHKICYDLYIVIGDISKEGLVIKVFYKPGISLIWFGSLVLALAGFMGVLVKIVAFKQSLKKLN